MRKLILLLLFAAPLAGSLAALGQSLVPIPLQDCVWHAGDDPSGSMGWAKSELDESGWSPYADWKIDLSEPRIWVRCHADLASLRMTKHPALQVTVQAAYQLFVDGSPTGAFGNMRTGDFTADDIRTFPLATPLPVQARSIIVLRLLFRASPERIFSGLAKAGNQEFLAGDRGWLEDRRNSLVFIDGSRQLPTTLAFGIVGIAGFMLLGLYLNDRSRRAFLFFAIHCWALASLRILQQLEASHDPMSLVQYRLVYGFLVAALPSFVLMVYALARKPLPLFYKVMIGLSMVLPLRQAIMALAPAAQSLRIDSTLDWTAAFSNLPTGLIFLSPFAAFGPWRRLSSSMRYVVATLMVWAVANAVFIALVLSRNLSLSPVAEFGDTWMPAVQQIRALFIIAAIVILLVLLFGDQRKTADERAQLAGEMEAAREIQQRLVPAALPPVAGLRIAAAFVPAAEVGGDFYQVLPQRDGSSLIVVGDVSGKGLKAAMTGTLAIGALRTLASEGLSPGAIMQRLNQQMVEAGSDGFITCLILHASPHGLLTIANAGHLNPYLNGNEVASENGLPLGLAPGIHYAETALQLSPGDQLTLLTDGVLEARNPSGELFGFERTAAISTQSAEAIAQRAQHFGQEDDITVVTIVRLDRQAQSLAHSAPPALSPVPA